jgi:hypothetical protein
MIQMVQLFSQVHVVRTYGDVQAHPCGGMPPLHAPSIQLTPVVVQNNSINLAFAMVMVHSRQPVYDALHHDQSVTCPHVTSFQR